MAVQTRLEAETGWIAGGGAAPGSTPASTMAQQLEITASMAALVETMKQEMDWQVLAMTALSVTVAKLTGQPPQSRRDELPEIEEPTVMQPQSLTADDLQLAKVSQGDGMAGVADAFVCTLEERLGAGGVSTGEEQVADTHTLRQIARTHPALVQLLEHNNNPHTLGMLVRRAVSFDFAPEQCKPPPWGSLKNERWCQ
eukprot:61436-Rhodomonas_salina.1